VTGVYAYLGDVYEPIEEVTPDFFLCPVRTGNLLKAWTVAVLKEVGLKMLNQTDFIDLQVDGYEATFAHFLVRYSQIFSDRITEASTGPVRDNLLTLLTIFVTFNLQPYVGTLVSLGVVRSTSLIDSLKSALFTALAKIRPIAVPLVDAFEFDDLELVSAIGSFDGDVYNRLFA
jgi:acyl-CoA oxidase